MIDVKKLISGFLILAAAAVGSGFILSFAGNFIPPSTGPEGPSISETGAALDASAALGGANAFVDTGSLQGNAAEMLSDITTSSTAAVASDPDNLTNTFADSFLNGLVAANPDGASTDSNGNPDFNTPDAQAVSQALASDPTFQNFKTPDWDAEAAKVKIITTSNNSSENVDNYILSFNNVYQKYIANTDIGGILGEENAADAQTITNQTQDALNAVAAIPTPSSMVGLQESYIKLLVYEKNSAQLIPLAATDPLKASLTFQDEQPNYDLAVTNFSNQWNRLSASMQASALITNPPQNKAFAFIDSFLDIPTANAQMVVHDPAVFTVVSGQLSVNTAQLGKTIEKYVEDIALQILINTLTNLIQRKVLTWIQGSGAPRFVTDFGTQMVNAFQTAAVSKLNSYMQCVPSYQAPAIKALLSTPTVANKNVCAAEFNGQLNNNLQNFYNNFDNFNNYLSLFQSGGNVWSLTVQTRDAAVIAGGQNQTAKQTQTVAQQGWKGSEVCDDKSDPNGVTTLCQSASGDIYQTAAGKSCNSGDMVYFTSPNNGQCSDGTNPQVTSPGQATGQGFFSSLKSGTENITSAKNLAGIFNALLSSVLNTLAQDAIQFSNTELNNLENGSSGGTSDSGILGVSSSSLILSSSSSTSATQCIPADQTAIFDASTSQATASFSAAGGTIDSTCAGNNDCPSTENSDGTPIYSWSAPGSLNYTTSGSLPTGDSFFTTYNATGTYFVTATASTDSSTSTCEVDVTTGQ
jgi:hypothetical protein